MRLKLIRHGESVANQQRIWQGQMEFPLSDIGREQADKVGKWLAHDRIDALYSSDLSRAFETAVEIGKHHNMEPVSQQELREMYLGQFQGLTHAEVEEKHPGFAHSDWLISGIGGVEVLGEIQGRAMKLIDHLWQRHAGEEVICVSHGGFISLTLMAILHIEWPKRRVFAIGNTSITTLEFQSREHCVVLGVNESPHLATNHSFT